MFRLRAPRFDGVRPLIALAFAAALLAPVAGNAQGFGFPGGALVTTDMNHSLSVFHPGSVGYVAITADIAAGWHINAEKPLESYLIPTVLAVSAPPGIEIVRLLYPAPVLRKLEISETRMALYDGVAVFGALIRIGANVAPGAYRLTATLSYQGCNDLTCVEPASASADDTIRVGTLDEGVELLDAEVFSKPPFAGDDGAPAGVEAAPPGAGDFGSMIAERGLALTFLIIFFSGLALNLTPCIYPLIPITISYFGGQAGGRASRVFLLAFLYVLGMSLTYSVLGMIAAMTGNLFGAALQNPFVVIMLAAILVALALSMFGLWEIRIPMFLARRTGSGRQGYAGAVVMGLTMGIVAAPCIGPFVLGLLTYTPEWARPAGTSDKWGPSTLDAIFRFGVFSALAAQRYASVGVNHFEVWNEANIWLFWEPTPNPELYTVLLKTTAYFLRAANPNVKIVTTGMAPAEYRNDSRLAFVNRTFLSRMYAAGAKGSFDYVGVHPYSFPVHPLEPSQWNTFYRLPELFGVMVSHGDGDKKMWATESGFPTGTHSQALTEATQADWTDDLIWSWFDYDFADVFMWFSYRDCGTDLSNPRMNMGIVRHDFSAKAARDAFRRAVNPSVPIPTPNAAEPARTAPSCSITRFAGSATVPTRPRRHYDPLPSVRREEPRTVLTTRDRDSGPERPKMVASR